MTTPPKAPCHSCNGTGIDPTVGFLDCEFCTPAFAGVSLSAPEQPAPKCATCNDHGEIGCLRPDGYDGERCPECNPVTVKRYHVTEAGLVEGQALGRINVVLGADHDRVTADADRLRAELECSRGDFAQLERIRDALQVSLDAVTFNLDKTDKVALALQQRLTAADERADVLETEVARLSRVKLALKELVESHAGNLSVYRYHLGETLVMAEKVRGASLGMQRKCLADLIDYLHQSGAALKPAEGGGDES